MKKVLFLSFSNLVKDYNIFMHVDSARIKEYYTLLNDRYDVDFHVVDKESNIIPSITNFNYDFIFIFHEETYHRLLKNDISLFTKPVFIQLDCAIWPFTHDWNIMNKFVAVGIAHPPSFEKIKHTNKYLIHNACVYQENLPKIDNNGSLLYIGRIKGKTNKLIKFSKAIKRNIDLYTFDVDDVPNEQYIKFKGQLKYADLYKAINNHSYGLCFEGTPSPCGKVFDYLSYGLPVLYEDSIGEREILKNDNLGIFFNMNNLQNLNFIHIDTSHILNVIHQKHLWKNRIEQWFNIIETSI
jgi:hypothetical protein